MTLTKVLGRVLGAMLGGLGFFFLAPGPVGPPMASAQSYTVALPEVITSHLYTDDDGPPDNSSFIDFGRVSDVPRFDPLTGTLTDVAVSVSFDIQYDVALDTNGILNTGSPHSAFAEGNIEFGVSFLSAGGTRVSSVATERTSWSLGCTGDPTDMDGCQDSFGEGYTVELSGFVFSDNLADFIGSGNVGSDGGGSLEALIIYPTALFFDLNNVGGAGVDLFAQLSSGQITVEYSSNDGSSPETPLLPPPPGTLPSAFDEVDCVNSFCIPVALGDSGPGIDGPLFFDPPPAIGFDYQVVTGPNLAGIQIPAGFGDDLFELLVSTDGLNYQLFGQIVAETFYDLTAQFPSGVTHLRLLGIESDAGVDSEDSQGFPTGLTFVTGGAVVGIAMTPITVPEPSAALLILPIAALSIRNPKQGESGRS